MYMKYRKQDLKPVQYIKTSLSGGDVVIFLFFLLLNVCHIYNFLVL